MELMKCKDSTHFRLLLNTLSSKNKTVGNKVIKMLQKFLFESGMIHEDTAKLRIDQIFLQQRQTLFEAVDKIKAPDFITFRSSLQFTKLPRNV